MNFISFVLFLACKFVCAYCGRHEFVIEPGLAVGITNELEGNLYFEPSSSSHLEVELSDVPESTVVYGNYSEEGNYFDIRIFDSGASSIQNVYIYLPTQVHFESLRVYSNGDIGPLPITEKRVLGLGVRMTECTAGTSICMDCCGGHSGCSSSTGCGCVDCGECVRWTGAESNDWSEANNWNPARVPQFDDCVIIADAYNGTIHCEEEYVHIHNLTVENAAVRFDGILWLNSLFVGNNGNITVEINATMDLLEMTTTSSIRGGEFFIRSNGIFRSLSPLLLGIHATVIVYPDATVIGPDNLPPSMDGTGTIFMTPNTTLDYTGGGNCEYFVKIFFECLGCKVVVDNCHLTLHQGIANYGTFLLSNFSDSETTLSVGDELTSFVFNGNCIISGNGTFEAINAVSRSPILAEILLVTGIATYSSDNTTFGNDNVIIEPGGLLTTRSPLYIDNLVTRGGTLEGENVTVIRSAIIEGDYLEVNCFLALLKTNNDTIIEISVQELKGNGELFITGSVDIENLAQTSLDLRFERATVTFQSDIVVKGHASLVARETVMNLVSLNLSEESQGSLVKTEVLGAIVLEDTSTLFSEELTVANVAHSGKEWILSGNLDLEELWWEAKGKITGLNDCSLFISTMTLKAESQMIIDGCTMVLEGNSTIEINAGGSITGTGHAINQGIITFVTDQSVGSFNIELRNSGSMDVLQNQLLLGAPFRLLGTLYIEEHASVNCLNKLNIGFGARLMGKGRLRTSADMSTTYDYRIVRYLDLQTLESCQSPTTDITSTGTIHWSSTNVTGNAHFVGFAAVSGCMGIICPLLDFNSSQIQSCGIPGCNVPQRAQYLPIANIFDFSCDPDVLYGCTDPRAINYVPSANADDGSCIIIGCLEAGAENYEPNANTPGPCFYVGCTNPRASNFHPDANLEDGSCLIYGCLIAADPNFDPEATVPNNTMCSNIGGCTVPHATNYHPNATVDDGSCIYTNPLPAKDPDTLECLETGTGEINPVCVHQIVGCQDPEALNYRADAELPGPCISKIIGCSDVEAINYDPDVNTHSQQLCVYPTLPPPTIPSENGKCGDPEAVNYYPSGDNNSSCLYCGCTDQDAKNYDPQLCCSDNSKCLYDFHVCQDPSASNFVRGASGNHNIQVCKYEHLACRAHAQSLAHTVTSSGENAYLVEMTLETNRVGYGYNITWQWPENIQHIFQMFQHNVHEEMGYVSILPSSPASSQSTQWSLKFWLLSSTTLDIESYFPFITWNGTNCGRASFCPFDCHNSGECTTSNTCICNDDVGGRYCELNCREPCNGHGSMCHKTGLQSPFLIYDQEKGCVCDEPFYGEQCQFLCDRCSYHGSLCKRNRERKALKSCDLLNRLEPDFTCSCLDNFAGKDCSVQCSGEMICSGHGSKCRDGELLGYCTCVEGWEGIECDEPLCAQCNAHQGNCVIGESLESIPPGICECSSHFVGPTCSVWNSTSPIPTTVVRDGKNYQDMDYAKISAYHCFSFGEFVEPAREAGPSDAPRGTYEYLVAVIPSLIPSENEFISVGRSTAGCISPHSPLLPGQHYYTHVKACKESEECTIIASDGIVYDDSPPTIENFVVDGYYSHNKQDLDVSFELEEYETPVVDLLWCLSSSSLMDVRCDILNWQGLIESPYLQKEGFSFKAAKWHEKQVSKHIHHTLSLSHQVHMFVHVKATNAAGLVGFGVSQKLTFDQTPPINKGIPPQVPPLVEGTTQVPLSLEEMDMMDEESGIYSVKVLVIVNGQELGSKQWNLPSTTEFIPLNRPISFPSEIVIQVLATNGAGLSSLFFSKTTSARAVHGCNSNAPPIVLYDEGFAFQPKWKVFPPPMESLVHIRNNMTSYSMANSMSFPGKPMSLEITFPSTFPIPNVNLYSHLQLFVKSEDVTFAQRVQLSSTVRYRTAAREIQGKLQSLNSYPAVSPTSGNLIPGWNQILIPLSALGISTVFDLPANYENLLDTEFILTFHIDSGCIEKPTCNCFFECKKDTIAPTFFVDHIAFVDARCVDCSGEYYGSKKLDNCGRCVNPGESCLGHVSTPFRIFGDSFMHNFFKSIHNSPLSAGVSLNTFASEDGGASNSEHYVVYVPRESKLHLLLDPSETAVSQKFSHLCMSIKNFVPNSLEVSLVIGDATQKGLIGGVADSFRDQGNGWIQVCTHVKDLGWKNSAEQFRGLHFSQHKNATSALVVDEIFLMRTQCRHLANCSLAHNPSVAPLSVEILAPQTALEGSMQIIGGFLLPDGHHVIKAYFIIDKHVINAEILNNKVIATNVFEDNGMYRVTLIILDSNGNKGVIHGDFHIENSVPSIVCPQFLRGSGAVHLSLSINDPGKLDSHTVTIEWGDSTWNVYQLDSSFKFLNTSHSYTVPFLNESKVVHFSGKVTVMDKDGAVVHQYLHISIEDPQVTRLREYAISILSNHTFNIPGRWTQLTRFLGSSTINVKTLATTLNVEGDITFLNLELELLSLHEVLGPAGTLLHLRFFNDSEDSESLLLEWTPQNSTLRLPYFHGSWLSLVKFENLKIVVSATNLDSLNIVEGINLDGNVWVSDWTEMNQFATTFLKNFDPRESLSIHGSFFLRDESLTINPRFSICSTHHLNFQGLYITGDNVCLVLNQLQGTPPLEVSTSLSVKFEKNDPITLDAHFSWKFDGTATLVGKLRKAWNVFALDQIRVLPDATATMVIDSSLAPAQVRLTGIMRLAGLLPQVQDIPATFFAFLEGNSYELKFCTEESNGLATGDIFGVTKSFMGISVAMLEDLVAVDSRGLEMCMATHSMGELEKGITISTEVYLQGEVFDLLMKIVDSPDENANVRHNVVVHIPFFSSSSAENYITVQLFSSPIKMFADLLALDNSIWTLKYNLGSSNVQMGFEGDLIVQSGTYGNLRCHVLGAWDKDAETLDIFGNLLETWYPVHNFDQFYLENLEMRMLIDVHSESDFKFKEIQFQGNITLKLKSEGTIAFPVDILLILMNGNYEIICSPRTCIPFGDISLVVESMLLGIYATIPNVPNLLDLLASFNIHGGLHRKVGPIEMIDQRFVVNTDFPPFSPPQLPSLDTCIPGIMYVFTTVDLNEVTFNRGITLHTCVNVQGDAAKALVVLDNNPSVSNVPFHFLLHVPILDNNPMLLTFSLHALESISLLPEEDYIILDNLAATMVLTKPKETYTLSTDLTFKLEHCSPITMFMEAEWVDGQNVQLVGNYGDEWSPLDLFPTKIPFKLKEHISLSDTSISMTIYQQPPKVREIGGSFTAHFFGHSFSMAMRAIYLDPEIVPVFQTHQEISIDLTAIAEEFLNFEFEPLTYIQFGNFHIGIATIPFNVSLPYLVEPGLAFWTKNITLREPLLSIVQPLLPNQFSLLIHAAVFEEEAEMSLHLQTEIYFSLLGLLDVCGPTEVAVYSTSEFSGQTTLCFDLIGDPNHFVMQVEGSYEASSTWSLGGALLSPNPWSTPFGIPNLVVHNAAGSISITAGLLTGFSIFGTIHIGSVTVDIQSSMAIDKPFDSFFYGSIINGLTLKNIGEFFGTLMGNPGMLTNLPDVVLRDVKMYFYGGRLAFDCNLQTSTGEQGCPFERIHPGYGAFGHITFFGIEADISIRSIPKPAPCPSCSAHDLMLSFTIETGNFVDVVAAAVSMILPSNVEENLKNAGIFSIAMPEGFDLNRKFELISVSMGDISLTELVDGHSTLLIIEMKIFGVYHVAQIPITTQVLIDQAENAQETLRRLIPTPEWIGGVVCEKRSDCTSPMFCTRGVCTPLQCILSEHCSGSCKCLATLCTKLCGDYYTEICVSIPYPCGFKCSSIFSCNIKWCSRRTCINEFTPPFPCGFCDSN